MGRKWFRKKYEHEMILSRHREPGPLPFVVVLDRLKAGYNVPKIIRSANAFGCRELHFVGIPMFNPTPAMGTLRKTRSRSFDSVELSLTELRNEGYAIHALAPDGDRELGEFELPEKSAFVVGHEEYGLSFDWRALGVTGLRIPHLGEVQSLNAAVAASVACFEYLRQHRSRAAFPLRQGRPSAAAIEAPLP